MKTKKQLEKIVAMKPYLKDKTTAQFLEIDDYDLPTEFDSIEDVEEMLENMYDSKWIYEDMLLSDLKAGERNSIYRTRCHTIDVYIRYLKAYKELLDITQKAKCDIVDFNEFAKTKVSNGENVNITY